MRQFIKTHISNCSNSLQHYNQSEHTYSGDTGWVS